MKLAIASLGALAAASSAALAADPAGFDLWQSAEAGRSVIAVAAIGDKAPFAAAAGETGTALDLLPADEASLLIAGLRERTAIRLETAKADIADDEDAAGHDRAHHGHHAGEAEAEAGKVILIKEIVESGKGKSAKKSEERRIIKLKADGDISDAEIAALVEKAKADLKAGDGAKIEVETARLSDEDADAAMLASAKAGKTLVIEDVIGGAPLRFVSVSGADAGAARAFIDAAAGLDDAEKSKMKADLGL